MPNCPARTGLSADSRRPDCARALAISGRPWSCACVAHHEDTHLLLGEEPGKQLREGQPHPGGLVFKRSRDPPGLCTYPKDLCEDQLCSYDCPPCLLKPAGSMSGKPFVKLCIIDPLPFETSCCQPCRRGTHNLQVARATAHMCHSPAMRGSALMNTYG